MIGTEEEVTAAVEAMNAKQRQWIRQMLERGDERAHTVVSRAVANMRNLAFAEAKRERKRAKRRALQEEGT